MSNDFTLTQLRYFMAVAEAGSMTAAAQLLSVTQSTVSAAIAQLEHEVGQPLFLRLARRGLELTPAGRRLRSRALGFLEDAGTLLAAVRDEDAELEGEMTVGIFAPLAPFRAPVILQAFERAYPKVHVRFFEADQEGLRLALAQGRCEVALMYDLGVAVDAESQVVETVAPHVIVAADHPAAANPFGEVSLRDLEADPFVLYDVPHSRDYFLALFRQLGLTPRVRHRASGYETVRSFVSRGHGDSILNQRLHHDLTSPVVRWFRCGSLKTCRRSRSFCCSHLSALRHGVLRRSPLYAGSSMASTAVDIDSVDDS
ncbi:LysR family transcriptional regulator [Gordonia sputi]|uniref:Putative LysR family transcriptional regulator n=1 Tax=Gordonia sputi NBRC 100414 TaxID=1089453 RepID=H5U372_9ACTN|nr:LysR family transcriptional regulator [Gordonia sputi]GAB40180.1 putative LysR family transcriptional regulator [Gordonia sputi NBRC 100414]